MHLDADTPVLVAVLGTQYRHSPVHVLGLFKKKQTTSLEDTKIGGG